MNLYTKEDALLGNHGILAAVSSCFVPVGGRLHTRYAPVRHSCASCIATFGLTVRLACIKPAASVHPEPGSNSPSYLISFSCLSVPASSFFIFLYIWIAWSSQKNNLSYLLHLSIHSKNNSRFPLSLLSATLRRLPHSHRSTGAQNGTAKIHFLFTTTPPVIKIFEKNFFSLVITGLHLLSRQKITKKRLFHPFSERVQKKSGLHFRSFSEVRSAKMIEVRPLETFNKNVSK